MDKPLLVFVGIRDSEISGQIRQALNICFAGCEIRAVISGKQCIRMVKRHEPDLIILDSYLEDMDGSEAVRTIRTFTLTPVLMFSYIKDEYELVKALEAGANELMVKPFHQMEFIARVRSILRSHPPGSAGGNQGAGVRAFPPA